MLPPESWNGGRRWVEPGKDAQRTPAPFACDETRRPPAEPHSIADLLDCPPAVGDRLGRGVERIDYAVGGVVFAQNAPSQGLFLLVSGEYWKTAQRRGTRLTLGVARCGELLELAAVLGGVAHTYTLRASIPSMALLFPKAILEEAFALHPPMRMRLLKELGREVSCSYGSIYVPRRTRNRAPRAIA